MIIARSAALIPNLFVIDDCFERIALSMPVKLSKSGQSPSQNAEAEAVAPVEVCTKHNAENDGLSLNIQPNLPSSVHHILPVHPLQVKEEIQVVAPEDMRVTVTIFVPNFSGILSLSAKLYRSMTSEPALPDEEVVAIILFEEWPVPNGDVLLVDAIFSDSFAMMASEITEQGDLTGQVKPLGSLSSILGASTKVSAVFNETLKI